MKETAVFHTFNEEETEEAARDFAKNLKGGDFLAFFGDLGSGKTAFIRGLADVFCKGARFTPEAGASGAGTSRMRISR